MIDFVFKCGLWISFAVMLSLFGYYFMTDAEHLVNWSRRNLIYKAFLLLPSLVLLSIAIQNFKQVITQSEDYGIRKKPMATTTICVHNFALLANIIASIAEAVIGVLIDDHKADKDRLVYSYWVITWSETIINKVSLFGILYLLGLIFDNVEEDLRVSVAIRMSAEE